MKKTIPTILILILIATAPAIQAKRDKDDSTPDPVVQTEQQQTATHVAIPLNIANIMFQYLNNRPLIEVKDLMAAIEQKSQLITLTSKEE